MSNLLTISKLTKNYHTKKQSIKALEDISFSLDNGEFIVLVGPSGCGKSTILSIVGNLEKASSGNISFVNNNIKLGYMFQEDSLFPWLTVLDNCLIGLKINKKINKESLNHVKTLLKKYGLSDFQNSYPQNLSGGMRQRVALIRTLAINPDILLLDEPFSALDYQTRITVSNDVYKIIKEENKTALMVTHDIGEAISMGDKVIVLSNRPSKIKNVYLIESREKRLPSENRNSPEFMKYYNLIWGDMDHYEC
ncbi:MAG: ABC transporter ATP-binding protein [Bacilli bacterium]